MTPQGRDEGDEMSAARSETARLSDLAAKAVYDDIDGGWSMEECRQTGDAVLAAIGLEPAGHGWCPVHGEALCPEGYMLRLDGTPSVFYRDAWSEDLRCGKRQPTYRLSHIGRHISPITHEENQ